MKDKKQRRVQVEPTPENIAKVRKECEVRDYPIRTIMEKLHCTYLSAVILSHEAKKKA
jgi:hypothetical protein